MADSMELTAIEVTKRATAMTDAGDTWSIPAEWGVGTQQAALISSIDEKTQEGRDALMEALMTPGEDPATYINKEVALCDVTIHPISFVSKDTGEHVQTTRVLLHTKEGKTLDFRSDGILKSLYLIFRFQGYPPYATPKRFILERLPVGDNHSMYALRPVKATDVKGKGKSA